MKRLIVFKGDRYRLDGRRKRRANRGEVFWNDARNNFTKAVATTADKFYCYVFEGKGPYYIYQQQRNKSNSISSNFSHRFLIMNAETNKIVTTVADKRLVKGILDHLNSTTTSTSASQSNKAQSNQADGSENPKD